MKSPQDRNKPLKVCHLITDSGVGGAEKILYELVTRLDPERFRCRVIVMKKPGAVAKELGKTGVTVTSLKLPQNIGPAYVLRLLPAVAGLISELRRDRPDVLHCWLFQANIAGRIAARLARVPINISSLRVLEAERMIQYPLDRVTALLVTRYVAVAEAVADHYRNKLDLPGERIEVIVNGVDIQSYEGASGDRLREELGLPEDAWIIGTAGRLHKQKGVDLLIQTMQKVRESCPAAVLLIAGEGPERETLQQQARALPERAVRFLGEWKRMDEFFSLLHVFVLASRWEGMPNALLEAMAAKVPVVASRTGGVPEVIGCEHEEDKEPGIMVEPGSPVAYAEALLSLWRDPQRREAMRQNAGERAALFSLDRMAERYGRLYEELSLAPRRE